MKLTVRSLLKYFAENFEMDEEVKVLICEVDDEDTKNPIKVKQELEVVATHSKGLIIDGTDITYKGY